MNPETYKTHVVFEKLGQYKEALASEKINDEIGLDNIAYLESAYHYIKDKLKLTISILVQEAELNNLAKDIENSTVQLNAYIGNGNIGHITNAINGLNTAITRTRNLPVPISKGDFDFSKAIAQFQQNVKSAYEGLSTKNKNLSDELSATQTDLLQKQQKIEVLEKTIDEKQIEIQNVLLSYNTEFEALKSSANSSIDADRKRFSETFDSDRKDNKAQLESDREIIKAASDTQKKELEKEAAEIIEILQKKQSEASKIVSIVGNIGVTGNYQNIANSHKKSANIFRWIAMGFMVVMSALLIYSIIELGNDDFDLYKSLVRILAAAVLTYPAVYASRESTRHRNLETQNRNLELELASIGPFIELLPEDKRQKIKEELANKYFGNNQHGFESKSDDNGEVSVNGLEKILKTILPYIKK